MDLSQKAVRLLENNEIARIIKKLLDPQHYRYTCIEGKDAKIATGGVLRFDDHSNEEVHSIAKELCNEGILDCDIVVTLPVYYLEGEMLVPRVTAPRNEELRKKLLNINCRRVSIL